MNLQTHFEVRQLNHVRDSIAYMKLSFSKCTCCKNIISFFANEYSLLFNT